MIQQNPEPEPSGIKPHNLFTSDGRPRAKDQDRLWPTRPYGRPAGRKLVTFLDLGVVADMIIGGIAAIIVLRFVSPVDIVQLITTSLVAGLGGSGIIEASVNRLRAEVAGEQVRTQMERTGKVAASTKALLMKIKSREMMKAAPHAAIAQMDVELTQEIAKHGRAGRPYNFTWRCPCSNVCEAINAVNDS